MENVTLGQVLVVILAIASAISMTFGAAEKVAKTWKALKAPNARQDDQIHDMEKWREGVDRKLLQDYERLNAIEESNRVTQRSILALLGHGIDGNNIEQMQAAKTQLENHLINR